MSETNNYARFHYYIIFAIIGYRINDCITKVFLENTGVMEVMFYRSLLTMALFPILFYFKPPNWSLFKNQKVMLRNVLAGVSMLLEIAALKYLTLSVFILVNYSVPFFAKIFARIFLGEKIEAFDFAVMTVSCLGLLMIIDPISQTHISITGAALATAGAMLYALSMVATRSLKTADTFSVYYSYVIVVFLMTAIGWPIQGFAQVNWYGYGALACIHCLSFIFIVKGLMMLKTSRAAILEYSGIVAAIALDYWVFKTAIKPIEMLGGGVMLLAVLVSTYREKIWGFLKNSFSRPQATQEVNALSMDPLPDQGV